MKRFRPPANLPERLLKLVSLRRRECDVMRVQNDKIADHWGVGNSLPLMQQIGGRTPSAADAITREI